MAKKSTKRSKVKKEIRHVDDVAQVRDVSSPPEITETSGDGTPAPLHHTGLTSLSEYYEEPEPEALLTAEEIELIRADALRRQFGEPIKDFREGVVARLNSKLRS